VERETLWVEPVGNIIVARLRGQCTEAVLKEMQARVLQLVADTRQGRVLYDALEMDVPTDELALVQERLDKETREMLGGQLLRKAILVPSTRHAYLARIAFGQFGEGEYRVFYNDLAQAVRWLEEWVTVA
jgi:hypothetical protein